MNFKSIAISALAVAATTFTGVAEARPAYTVCDSFSNGNEICVEPVGRYGVEVTINNPYTRTGFIAVKNCATGEYRWRLNDGYSQATIANSLRIACNM